MERVIYYYDVVLAVLYLLLVVLYTRNFLSPHKPSKSHTYALPLILLLHFLKLMLQGLLEGHCPILGIYQASSFTAFAVAVIYFLVERYRKYFATGAIFVSIAFVLQSVSIFAERTTVFLPAGLGNVPIGLHAPVALFGLAAMTTAAIYSVIYLVSMHFLKTKHFGQQLREIPPLETVEKMQSFAALAGLLLISLSLVIGVLLGFVYGQDLTIFDSKILSSLTIVLIFGFVLIRGRFGTISGRRRSVLLLAGFFAAILLVVVARQLPTFHRF